MNNRADQDARVFIIDASIFIFKYYFSMPSHWHADNGRPTETVYGYTRWLWEFLSQVEPARVIACFDESLTTCFRNDIYPDYKKSRALPDDDLAFQLLACKRITQLFGIRCYASEKYEADDLIGSCAQLCQSQKVPVTILSNDKDLAQLLRLPSSHLWNYPADDPLNEKDIYQKMAVWPQQIPDYLALLGDVSDDIPGVPGVGKKTAAQLLNHFLSWSAMKESLHDIHSLPIRGAQSLEKKIIEYASQIDMALKLTTIACDAIAITIEDTCRQAGDWIALVGLLRGLGLPESFCQRMENKKEL